MFSLVSGLYESYLAPVTLNVLIVGPPGAGKTAVLERLKGTQLPKRANSSSASRAASGVHPIPPSLARALAETSGITLIDETSSEPKDQSSSVANTNADTSVAVASNANTTVSSSPSALLPPIVVTQRKRRFFPVSICPAPERYKQAAAAADDDEEFVYDDEEDGNSDEESDDENSKDGDREPPTNDSTDHPLSNNVTQQPQTDSEGMKSEEPGMMTIPLDAPLTPKAPRRQRLHSREFSVESLDLSQSDINEYGNGEQNVKKSSKKKKNKKKPKKGESPKAMSAGIGSVSVTKNHCPLHQKSNQNYDVKASGKLLPMSKIRPTSKYQLHQSYNFDRQDIASQQATFFLFSVFLCATVGTNLAKLEIHGAMCHFFDVGGKMQSLWERYYTDCDAVIFCWKVQDDPEVDPNDEKSDDDSDDPPPFDMKLQQELLQQVRQSIPDDVPFLVLGHVFGNAHEGIVNHMYNTSALLPRYHNPTTAMCCGSAKTGAGMVFAMDWLVPLAKRLQKERVGRAAQQPKEI